MINLSNYSIYEKLDWLTNYDDYEVLDSIFEHVGNSAIIEEMIAEFEHGAELEDRCYGDWVTWFLEGSTVGDAVEWLEACEAVDIRDIIDQVVVDFGLHQESDANEGFTLIDYTSIGA